MDRVVENVACTVCGCVCDDLRVTVSARRIVRTEGACKLAEPWLLSQGERRPSPRWFTATPAPLQTAVGMAAEILGRRNPLVYGLSPSSTEGQQAAPRWPRRSAPMSIPRHRSATRPR